jgi:hypothetical protein
MPVSEDQLRELLTERSDPARRRPVPEERIAIRVRRARRRRAAGAGLLAVAAVAGAASGVILTHEPAPGHAASYNAPPLPASFTASDGAAYRRLAITPVTGPDQRSASFTITAGSHPVDVMATCDHRKGTTFVLVKVNGSVVTFADCQGPGRLTDLAVKPGQRARITFAAGSPIGSRIAGWQFAAYAWTPPVIARPAPAEPRPPRSFTGLAEAPAHGNVQWRLVSSRSGDWPADRTVSITVPTGARYYKLSLVCAGPVSERLQVTFSNNGSQPSLMPSCVPLTPGQPVPAQLTIDRIDRIDRKPTTLTIHLQAPRVDPAAYAKRQVSWTLALYAEHK